MESEVDPAPHTRLNAAMKLEVVRAVWTHAHSVLPARVLAGSPSEVLLSWLMEKGAELVGNGYAAQRAHAVGHALCRSWAPMLQQAARRPPHTFTCSGVPAARPGQNWNWTTDVRARVWRVFTERWPSRQPRTPLLRSPKKTSDGPDKENSPAKPPVLSSVLEYIAMASPGGGGALKPGKRRALGLATHKEESWCARGREAEQRPR